MCSFSFLIWLGVYQIYWPFKRISFWIHWFSLLKVRNSCVGFILMGTLPPAAFKNYHFSVFSKWWLQSHLLHASWYRRSVSVHTYFQIWGWFFALDPHFTDVSKKSYEFSLFSYFPFIRVRMTTSSLFKWRSQKCKSLEHPFVYTFISPVALMLQSDLFPPRWSPTEMVFLTPGLSLLVLLSLCTILQVVQGVRYYAPDLIISLVMQLSCKVIYNITNQ